MISSRSLQKSKMKISAFALAALAPLILSFFVVESAVSNLGSFTFLGTGFCQDSQSNSYDYVVYYLVADEEACATNCVGLVSSFGQGSVVGMEYSFNQTVCYCDFENSKLTSQPSASGGWFTGYEGTGLPISGNGNPEYPFKCYKLAGKPSPSKPVKLLPTKPISPTAPIVKKPPTRPVRPTPLQPTFTSNRFTYIGEGICMDSQNNYYDLVEYYNVATLEACAMTCTNLGTTYSTSIVVGMEYSASIKNCLCNFDNDAIKSQPVNSSDWYNENAGTGLPVTANAGFGDFNFTCYKRADTVSPMRPAPKRPTSPVLVTTPVKPTTPTTASPQLIYVGEGSCLSALNKTYDWALFYASPNLADCTNKCTSLAAFYTTGSMVGVEFYDTLKDCYCDFEDGKLNNTSQPSGSDEWNADNTGTGALVRTNGGNGILGWSCYKLPQTAANLAPRNPARPSPSNTLSASQLVTPRKPSPSKPS